MMLSIMAAPGEMIAKTFILEVLTDMLLVPTGRLLYQTRLLRHRQTELTTTVSVSEITGLVLITWETVSFAGNRVFPAL